MQALLLLKLKQQINRILHMPHNYNGGLLEMAIVPDGTLSREETIYQCSEIANFLKHHHEAFRNVRVNLIDWKGHYTFENHIVPMSLLQVGRLPEVFQSDQQNDKNQVNYSSLLAYLKKFHPRSKLVLILTKDLDSFIESYEKTNLTMDYLQPFLHRKLLIVSKNELLEGRKLL